MYLRVSNEIRGILEYYYFHWMIFICLMRFHSTKEREMFFFKLIVCFSLRFQ